MLAADVLLARLQGERVCPAFLVVERHADETPGDAPHLCLFDCHESHVRSTEGRGDAEWLTVTDGDVETAFTGWGEERTGVQVGGADSGTADADEHVDRP